jgi:hypothetical protein
MATILDGNQDGNLEGNPYDSLDDNSKWRQPQR